MKEKVIGYYKDTTNKELVDSGWVFEDYLKRTYDKYSPYPEEMNRKLVTGIADMYFAPTINNKQNL